MTGGPRVSVILPCYLSHDTVGGCLRALSGQRYRDFEVVVVDSSPDRRTAAVVETFPEVRLLRSQRRLLPHGARNRGVEAAGGELLVFSDPDVYPHPDWLGRLVAAHGGRRQRVVVGALECHGGRWLDIGVHLCKFSKWLPGGAPRPVDMSPTANMLVHRGTFTDLGGFRDDHFLADALFSWRLSAAGCEFRFEPRAVVEHHHTSGLGDFLVERYRRGVLFGDLRSRWCRHGRGRDLLFLAVSLLPVRLPRIIALVAAHCRAAGRLPALLSTWPVVVAGHGASLLGEATAYAARLGIRHRGVPPGGSRNTLLFEGGNASVIPRGAYRKRSPGDDGTTRRFGRQVGAGGDDGGGGRCGGAGDGSGQPGGGLERRRPGAVAGTGEQRGPGSPPGEPAERP